MRGSRALVVWVVVSLAVGPAFAGCGGSPPEKLITEAQAVAAARAIVDLNEPMTVVLVRSGQMAEIYSGAYPSFPSEEAAKEWQAKLRRQAWRVDFVGVMTQDHAQCPGVVIPNATAQLILDRSTGELLTSVFGQPPCPPGTENPARARTLPTRFPPRSIAATRGTSPTAPMPRQLPPVPRQASTADGDTTPVQK